jgi:Cu2+-exporting ATPase
MATEAVCKTGFAYSVSDFRQVTGEGVEGTVAGVRVRVGKPAFVAALAGPMPTVLQAFTESHRGALAALGDERGWRAIFTFADALRPGAARLIADLRSLGITPVLLSGDHPESVGDVARSLGMTDARADLAPEDKRIVIAQLQTAGAVVAMMGDGINDAPALAQAQVSISLGTAAPLAQHTADVVILSDRVERAADAMRLARRTLAVIRENLAWAAAYNAVAIPAAAFGLVTPWIAAMGMSVSSLVVVANALRLARRRDSHVASAPGMPVPALA